VKKIVTIIGARPQFIKAAAVSRAITADGGIQERIVHTGQHFDSNMSAVFFQEMDIPEPHYHLEINSLSHGAMTGRMLEKIEEVLIREKPQLVLVYGDTNSTLAGALAAKKLHIKVAHVEAGLRSFNMNMPEEINRILTDRISNILFCPTDNAVKNLIHEGFEHFNIEIKQFGDVMYDAALYYGAMSSYKSDIINRLDLAVGKYAVVTVHRQENTDDRDRLSEIFTGIGMVSDLCGMPVILPVHPRTRKMLATFNIAIPAGIRLIDPLGFMEFLKTESNARLVLTDSGGVQEECCILGVPCVTIRENTERPETVRVGANVIAGYSHEGIVRASKEMLDSAKAWDNPFGDGHAGERIIDVSRAFYGK